VKAHPSFITLRGSAPAADHPVRKRQTAHIAGQGYPKEKPFSHTHPARCDLQDRATSTKLLPGFLIKTIFTRSVKIIGMVY